MKVMHKYLLFFSFFCIFIFPENVFSQKLHIDLKPDKNKIRIGEQCNLDLTIQAAASSKIILQLSTDSLNSFDIVKSIKKDTVLSADGQLKTYSQQLIVTNFDSGYKVIDPVKVYELKDGVSISDSAMTEALLIEVNTVPVDTTKEIKGIKPILDAPFDWEEYLPWIIGGVAALVLIGVVLYFILRPKPKKIIIEKVIPRIPHEWALEELKKIEQEQLWQAGKLKLYHSRIADTLRQYVEYRFNIKSPEMTTDETISAMKSVAIDFSHIELLHRQLSMADLVKFAKKQPGVHENESAMANAIAFVEATKPAETPKENKEVTS